MKISGIKGFIIFYILLLSLNLLWFLTGGSPLETESPLRFVIGSLMIFLLPGLVWGEIIGLRSGHFLETIALSFALTLALETCLLPVPFIAGASIKLWISLLFLICISGVIVLILKQRNSKESVFISPLWNFYKREGAFKISIPVFVSILLFIAYGVYRWGENIINIDGEKLLHLTFVRYYSSMPLIFKDIGIYRGMPPLNLVNLWEFLIAGWSSLVNIDPLLIFYRARFVIPVIGFSGMYLLINNIFRDRIKSEVVIWGVLIMSIGWLMLLSPSNLDWVKEDPLRGMMSFMGTAHHADSAMEILIPLNAGLVLLAFRKPDVRNILLLTGVLIASFMWHTREFFQTAIYAGIFGITLLIFPNIDRKEMFRKLGLIAGIFVVIAVCFFIVIALAVPKQSHGYDEFKLKEIALSYALQSLTDIRSLLHFPSDLRLTAGLDRSAILTNMQIAQILRDSWSFFLWLILSAIAVPFLVFRGSREDRLLSMFYMLLWVLTLCWGFSQLMLIVFTYSEINFTTPRLIYIFSYIVIGSGFYNLSQLLEKKGDSSPGRLVISYAAVFAAGIVIRLWWSNGMPLGKTISVLLSIVFIVSFIASYYPRLPMAGSLRNSSLFLSILAIFIFFVPILAKDYTAFISKIVSKGNQQVEWFNNNNPLGFSKDLISFLKSIKPKHTFLVNPLGNSAISIYVPQYTAVVPEGMGKTFLTAREIYGDIRAGRHPLFNTSMPELKGEFIRKSPDFSTDFQNWQGPASIKNDIAKAAPPMVLHSYRGSFTFTRIQDKGGNIIRVSPSQDKKEQAQFVSFGYALNDNGFNLKFRPGQEVVFVVSAKTKGHARIFILDNAGNTPETNEVDVTGGSWKQYTVRKRIRDGASALVFGILWNPENSNETLEIKGVRIYVADSIAAYYQAPIPINVNHDAVRDWLNKKRVDYLLVEKDYYSRLLPYFQSFGKDYDIVFNNKEKGEMVVRYRGR